MNLYVGNVGQNVTEEDLKTAFEAYGQVSSARVITDRFSGRSRGFGFVEMPNTTEARAAIAGLSGKDLKGTNLVVNEARPREGGRTGGGGYGGGGRGPSRGPRW